MSSIKEYELAIVIVWSRYQAVHVRMTEVRTYYVLVAPMLNSLDPD